MTGLPPVPWTPPPPPYPGGPAPPFPISPSRQYGGYPPCNPTSAWYYEPPPTGCVYGLDGSTHSWVPVVTRWEVMCLVTQAVAAAATIQEAPQDGNLYVRNGQSHAWVDVQSLDLDGGEYP